MQVFGFEFATFTTEMKLRKELKQNFLFPCKQSGIIPKGLRVKTPNVEAGMGRKFDRVMLQRAIQKLHRDLINIDRNIASIQINLREFNLGEKWVDDICNWSRKNAKRQVIGDRRKLDKKFE